METNNITNGLLDRIVSWLGLDKHGRDGRYTLAVHSDLKRFAALLAVQFFFDWFAWTTVFGYALPDQWFMHHLLGFSFALAILEFEIMIVTLDLSREGTWIDRYGGLLARAILILVGVVFSAQAFEISWFEQEINDHLSAEIRTKAFETAEVRTNAKVADLDTQTTQQIEDARRAAQTYAADRATGLSALADRNAEELQRIRGIRADRWGEADREEQGERGTDPGFGPRTRALQQQAGQAQAELTEAATRAQAAEAAYRAETATEVARREQEMRAIGDRTLAKRATLLDEGAVEKRRLAAIPVAELAAEYGGSFGYADRTDALIELADKRTGVAWGVWTSRIIMGFLGFMLLILKLMQSAGMRDYFDESKSPRELGKAYELEKIVAARTFVDFWAEAQRLCSVTVESTVLAGVLRHLTKLDIQKALEAWWREHMLPHIMRLSELEIDLKEVDPEFKPNWDQDRLFGVVDPLQTRTPWVLPGLEVHGWIDPTELLAAESVALDEQRKEKNEREAAARQAIRAYTELGHRFFSLVESFFLHLQYLIEENREADRDTLDHLIEELGQVQKINREFSDIRAERSELERTIRSLGLAVPVWQSVEINGTTVNLKDPRGIVGVVLEDTDLLERMGWTYRPWRMTQDDFGHPLSPSNEQGEESPFESADESGESFETLLKTLLGETQDTVSDADDPTAAQAEEALSPEFDIPELKRYLVGTGAEATIDDPLEEDWIDNLLRVEPPPRRQPPAPGSYTDNGSAPEPPPRVVTPLPGLTEPPPLSEGDQIVGAEETIELSTTDLEPADLETPPPPPDDDHTVAEVIDELDDKDLEPVKDVLGRLVKTLGDDPPS